ncbi:MAG: mechanosensitive ion channel family protein [Hyphomicrobiaceae bacterium]
MPIEQIYANAGAFLEGLRAWAGAALPNVIGAIVLLAAGLWIAGWAARTARRVIEHQKQFDPTLTSVIETLVRYAILIVVFVAVLSQLGIQTTSILTALGAAGLAIGLALQGTLSNVAAGFMLLWLRPFRVGDFIDTGSVAGTVKQVGLFASEIYTWDNVYQFVPNSELWNKRLANFSRLPTRLVEARFRIAYDDDIEAARSTLRDLANGNPSVLTEPPLQIFVSDLSENAVEISLRAWSSSTDYWPVLRYFNENGKIALERAGLTIPFPQREVHYHGRPEMPATARSGDGAT